MQIIQYYAVTAVLVKPKRGFRVRTILQKKDPNFAATMIYRFILRQAQDKRGIAFFAMTL